MAIGTYSELKIAVGNWLDHSLFTDRIPEFIALAEAKFNRRLRTRQQQTATTLTVSGAATTLPTDYLAWRRLTWEGDALVELEFVEPSYFNYAFPSSSAGVPRVFTIVGSNIYVSPTDDTDVELEYYARIPALSDSAPTNWLLTAHPDVYLFNTMAEAEGFGVNDERMPMWIARGDAALEEVSKLSVQTRGPSAIRIMGLTP